MTRTRSPGYTLLEVILSLVLTSLVLLCVAMAIDFQLRIAVAGRTHVEEAQLARILLHRVADDVRSAVVADPLGLEELVPTVTATYGSAPTSATEGEGSSNPSDSSVDQTELSAGNTSTDETASNQVIDPTQGLVAHSVPGVYGGSNWIQVDVDRPANLAHAGQAPANTDLSSPGHSGDLKTVAYYVAPPDQSPMPTGPEASGGLIRRELDRALTELASGQSSSGQPLIGERAIAPEVADVQFSYSDGTTWLDSWDMQQDGTLPLAVEITLTLQPAQRQDDWATALASATGLASSEEQAPNVYRLIVDIPMAKAVPTAETTMESDGSYMESSAEEGENPASSESP